jgi:hypothetical protein
VLILPRNLNAAEFFVRRALDRAKAEHLPPNGSSSDREEPSRRSYEVSARDICIVREGK